MYPVCVWYDSINNNVYTEERSPHTVYTKMAAQTNNSAYTHLFFPDTTAIAYANATADAGATADATTDATASTITCLLFSQVSLGGPIRELHGESIWECSSNNVQCSRPSKQTFKCTVYKNGEIISQSIA